MALAEAPTRSLRPRKRGDGIVKAAVTPAEDLVSRARLDGAVSFVVANAATGQILESYSPDLPQPPASTAKALTSLYAMDKLGLEHRFTTRVLATGPIINGRLEGDLILAGGGDPTLDTDGLGALADQLMEAGLREVAGAFRIWTGALPEVYEIDPEQPDHVAYNPGVGGLNLNYNRVNFKWERKGSSYDVTMGAPSARYQPDVEIAEMQVIDRAGPIYTFAAGAKKDNWTVARGALGSGGSRWLPVRKPGLYSGEVFQTLMLFKGIQLRGEILPALDAEGTVIASHESQPLKDVLKDMLEYSTNATAEIVGLSATARASNGVPEGLKKSAGSMNAWLNATKGTRAAKLEDHSGLGDDSRISAADMVRAMVATGYDGELRPLLKPFRVNDRNDLDVAAKTGTLNFVSALTGFLNGPAQPPLAFAIFCSNVDRRDALPMEQRERPEGGRAWLGRARTLQRSLLERWATVYSG